MRRIFKIKIFFVLVLMFSIIFTNPVIATDIEPLRIRINGEFVYIPGYDQQPIVKADTPTILIPIQVVMKALNFEVEWNGEIQAALFVQPGYSITVKINNEDIPIQDDINAIGTTHSAQLINNRMMVPLSIIPEMVGVRTRIDLEHGFIDITSLSNMPWHSWPINSLNWPQYLPQHVPGSVRLYPDEEFTSTVGSSNQVLFRNMFFTVPSEITRLVTNDIDVTAWLQSRVSSNLDTMALADFVQYFDISREDFDVAIEGRRQRQEYLAIQYPSMDFTCEMHELPNADIIFTFDNDIIRYFYRRE